MGFSIKWDFRPNNFRIFENGILFKFLFKFFGEKKQHFKIFVEISDSKSSLKSQIRNLRFLSDLAESTSTSVRSSWYLWFVLTPSRNCARDVWKFPNIFIEIEIFIEISDSCQIWQRAPTRRRGPRGTFGSSQFLLEIVLELFENFQMCWFAAQ